MPYSQWLSAEQLKQVYVGKLCFLYFNNILRITHRYIKVQFDLCLGHQPTSLWSGNMTRLKFILHKTSLLLYQLNKDYEEMESHIHIDTFLQYQFICRTRKMQKFVILFFMCYVQFEWLEQLISSKQACRP